MLCWYHVYEAIQEVIEVQTKKVFEIFVAIELVFQNGVFSFELILCAIIQNYFKITISRVKKLND